MKRKTMDGNEAAAYASYAFTEVATIYPITPSSPMAKEGSQKIPGQLRPEVRMGDGDEGPGPFQNAFVFQVRHAVFRDHVLDAGAGGGDGASRRELGDNLGAEGSRLVPVAGAEVFWEPSFEGSHSFFRNPLIGRNWQTLSLTV